MKFIDMTEEWLQLIFFGNTALEYLIALGVFIGALIAFKVVQMLIMKRLARAVEKTETDVDNALVSIVKTIKPQFYWFIAFIIGVQFIEIKGVFQQGIKIILISWVSYQVIVALQIFVDYFIRVKLTDGKDKSGELVSGILSGVSRIILWSMGILFILSNLGIEVTSLIAGLGIGGIAIALAAQNILSDLFSSLAIYFDKPFVPGDFIVVGKDKGTVIKVGVKTTRIKSLSGEEVVIPNTDITSARVANFRRMKERRVASSFGVVYETSQEKMKRIPELVKEVVKSTQKTRFDRVHFTQFGESALIFEMVYFVESHEYELFSDIRQDVLMGIKGKFEEEGIEMAFPTQTVRVVK